MEPTVKASLLWGAVGVFTFLVGLQAYHLLGGEFVGVGVAAGSTAFVGAVTAVLTHLLRPRVIAWQRR
ncbi:MAG: hypothetical protein ACOCY1_00170 [Halovenus sp.]